MLDVPRIEYRSLLRGHLKKLLRVYPNFGILCGLSSVARQPTAARTDCEKAEFDSYICAVFGQMRTAKGSLIVAFALVADSTIRTTATAFRNYNCATANNYLDHPFTPHLGLWNDKSSEAYSILQRNPYRLLVLHNTMSDDTKLSAVKKPHRSALEELSPSGAFQRKDSVWRNWISREPGAKFPPATGRYHLYVAYAW